MGKHLILILLMAAPLSGVADGLVVIANLRSGVSQIRRGELVNLYLGRSKKLSSGISAVPVDLPADSEQKQRFYALLVNKSIPEIQAYWARLLFTGLATPPRIADSTNEALELVSHNQGAIAYIDRSYADSSVKIIFEFDPQARQDFSRKLKWDPSDFSGEKFSWRLLPSAARVRPAPAAVHNSPSVRCAPLPYANDLTPCRDGFAC